MQTSEDMGGSGGESATTTTRDVRLLERAIRESWDLPEATRQAMVARLGTLMSDPTTKIRAFLAVAKTLTALSRINLSAVDVAIRAEVHEDLGERVANLEARMADKGFQR
jgi:hypothetical protein